MCSQEQKSWWLHPGPWIIRGRAIRQNGHNSLKDLPYTRSMCAWKETHKLCVGTHLCGSTSGPSQSLRRSTILQNCTPLGLMAALSWWGRVTQIWYTKPTWWHFPSRLQKQPSKHANLSTLYLAARWPRAVVIQYLQWLTTQLATCFLNKK